jgi:hypothetical protein|tara:strand:- start:496 stop:681 length:186 start_codon:yes stop_codon:yes gene_type:complete
MIEFMVVIWLGYNYDNPKEIGAWKTCDEAYEFAINTQPEFKAFACFDSAHYIKYRDNILSW